jgi:hypothetical protein
VVRLSREAQFSHARGKKINWVYSDAQCRIESRSSSRSASPLRPSPPQHALIDRHGARRLRALNAHESNLDVGAVSP